MSAAVFLDLGCTSRDDLDLNRLQQACGSLQTWSQTSPEQCRQHIGSANIVISNKVVLDRPLLRELASQVQLICVAATGTNNIDLEAAQEFAIPVTNIRDYASQSVAEHVIAMIFALRRQLPAWQQALQQGEWQRSPHFCLLDYAMPQIAGSTLAIIGHGVLGSTVEKSAKALGIHVIIAERPGQMPRAGRVAFEEALAQADIVSLHCPLTDQTRNLMDAQRLNLMKPDAILINTARGGLVDEQALLDALKSGRLAGAGIDVLAQEPPQESPLLLDEPLPNLIVTPHVAWASRSARQTLIDQLADIIGGWKAGGELPNRVV